MSNFLNIIESVFYEGDQADAYRTRKASEASKRNKNEWERFDRRDGYAGNTGLMSSQHALHVFNKTGDSKKAVDARNKTDKKFYSGEKKADDRVTKELNKRFDKEQNPYKKGYDAYETKKMTSNAKDAARRHARRHHEQYKESVIENPDLI